MSDVEMRRKILAEQRENLKRFCTAEVSQRLSAVVSFLQTQKIDGTYISMIDPI